MLVLIAAASFAAAAAAQPPAPAPYYGVQLELVPSTALSIGGKPELDRGQFFNLHSVPGNAVNWRPEDIAEYSDRLGVHLGRSFAVSGRMNTLPATPDGRVNESALAEVCAEHPMQLGGWPAASVDPVTGSKTAGYYPAGTGACSAPAARFVPADHAAAAEFWSAFLRHCSPAWQRRAICEVANEPYVDPPGGWLGSGFSRHAEYRPPAAP